MLLYLRRLLRMTKFLVAGRISRHSFRRSLNPRQRAVCMIGGGLVFCDYRDENDFFVG
jgi:hypothetical protein